MVTVYTTTDPKQATLVEMALRDAGIDFQIDNENAAAAWMTSPAVPIKVLVKKEDQQSAIRAIEHALRAIGEGPHPRG